ncbi:MAG TPA: alpha/beta hydrolase [Gaiellaceae bacterium]|jgi:pimeloyl-ACP methyl ester carboxylesterase
MRAATVVALLALALPGAAAAGDRFVSVNGHRLHLVCLGSGTPTVLLEAGFSLDASSWSGVLTQASSTRTRVCAYDRLGRGRSAGSPGTRTIAQVADDLDALIRAARLHPPVVLVGHSLGGLIARWEARSHPAAVSGLVLVESTPDDLAHFLPQPTLTSLGESIEVASAAAAMKRFDAARRRPLGSRPLVVIRAAAEGGAAPPSFQPWWNARQRELAGYSTNSTLAVAAISDHFAQSEQPELVAYAIHAVVTALRTKKPVAPCSSWPTARLYARCR